MPDPVEVELGEDPACLYRLYDADGALLYVGITFTPAERMAHHAIQQPWWVLVACKTMAWYPTRAAASSAETAAIKAERPKYNKRMQSHPATAFADGETVRLPAPPEGYSYVLHRRRTSPGYSA